MPGDCVWPDALALRKEEQMRRVFERISSRRRPLIGIAAALLAYALLGFVVTPWLIKKTAIDYVSSNLGATLDIEKVSVNPFVLSLGIDELTLQSPEGDALIELDRYFVNFQTSSLFRWAWTFREHHIDGLEVFVTRHADGHLNVDFLAQGNENTTDSVPEEKSGPVRLLVHDFAIRNSAIHWYDEVPPEPVDTEVGPINIAIADLNTLPERPGSQDVVITTESQGTLSWNGSLQFNPLHSEGSASVTGSHFPLTSAYLKHDVGFDVIDGIADVSLDYRMDVGNDGSLHVEVDNFNLTFSDVLVRTFNQAVGRSGEDREVLRLERIGLAGGAIRWPERTVTASALTVDGADIRVHRDVDGQLNVLPTDDDGATEPASTSSEPGEPWQASLEQFNVNGLVFQLQDESVTPAADIGWRSLDVAVRDISNAPGATFPTNITLTARDGGTIGADGTVVVLPEPVVDFGVVIENLALAGAHPYIRSLADVDLESGALNVSANFRSSPEDALSVTGDFEIVDFLITETDEGSRLGSWQSLLAENLAYSSSANTLGISEVRLAAPYGDILIAEDGSINLGRVRKGDEAGEENGESVAAEVGEEPASEPLAVTIGKVSIADAAADFADLSLPLPFSAQIAEMNGELSTISTTSAEPSVISLEGKVDEFGQVRISGTMTPLDPPRNTDVTVLFQNVDMPKFSAYSIPFAGREIASGRLDLDLGYTIADRKLRGENNIVLRDFELGEQVDHPGAMSLPLGLAVALLKDPEGKIDIDLPVEGDLDDPEFRIGGVVLQALGNLIVRIVTSPFALLANLVGVEPDELEFLVFEPGRSDLSPPELEKANKIAEALSLRPELALELTGVFATEEDSEALRTARVDALVESRIEALDNDAMYAENRQSVIESLFTESGIATDSTVALAELRATHTSPDTEEAPGAFDALAYTEALRRQLIDTQTVTSQELRALADARSAAIDDAIAAVDPALAGRIVRSGEITDVDVDDDVVPMRVRLATGDELGVQEPRDVGSGEPMRFQCGEDGPTLNARFEGPETVTVKNGASEWVLQRQRSASGARYLADGVEFWNKGEEAMFTDGDARHECVKIAD